MKAHQTVALSRRSAGSIPRRFSNFLKPFGHSADAQFEKRNGELDLAHIGAPLTISPPATTIRPNLGFELFPRVRPSPFFSISPNPCLLPFQRPGRSRPRHVRYRE